MVSYIKESFYDWNSTLHKIETKIIATDDYDYFSLTTWIVYNMKELNTLST